MQTLSFRPILAPVLGAAICFLVGPRPGAALREGPVHHFSARAVSVAGDKDGGPVDIIVNNWSTDADRDIVRETVGDTGPAKLLEALHHLHRQMGVVLMPGVQSAGARLLTRTPRNLVFAREIPTKQGRQLIFVSDQHIGLGELPWNARVAREEFNLLDIRIGRDGKGVGKLGTDGNITYNKRTKSLEVANFAEKPARLIDVKAETQHPSNQ